ncbi:hypothetical protein ATANTOWER_031996, partial [Ataeniobius toweri]|nr:hypothetical protein [Ataeniobius toweri]
DVCSEADATDLTERCELIGDRLIALEDKLQTAILNQDQALTHILPVQPKYINPALYFLISLCPCISVCPSELSQDFFDSKGNNKTIQTPMDVCFFDFVTFKGEKQSYLIS